MKVVIKVGTQSILSDDGTPFEPVLKDFVEQIATLQQNEHQIVLVSSEAVGSGRKVARQILGREYGNSIAEKQVLASLGQHELMHVYATMFKKHTILSSQIVLTKQDFQTRRHYLNISSVFREILECKNIIQQIFIKYSLKVEDQIDPSGKVLRQEKSVEPVVEEVK